MKLTNLEIQKHIKELPDNIRQAVITFDWAHEILAIAREHNMQIDDADHFRQQTMLVILGILPAEDYLQSIISEVGVSSSTAEQIVHKANTRIFRELQRRAFSKETEKTEAEHKDIILDPYQEPVAHQDIKDVLSDEGIHLVDEYEPEALDTELHHEVAAIFSGTRNREEEKIELNKEEKPEVSAPAEEEISADPVEYNEPIESQDLRGISSHRTNTEIIAQQAPTTSTTPRIRDLGQGDYVPQSLDKKMFTNRFISKGDSADLSPSETDIIKEEGLFLDHLKNNS